MPLIRPLQQLTEAEAIQRAEHLRQQGHAIHGMGCGASSGQVGYTNYTHLMQFAKGWQRMMARENEGMWTE